jgi:hypothetical protein|uniref:Uncharacterized protein n=1 Tax=viral metagenome TaxID=1070528 RepID=A0A6C0B7X0_9ZZZZ
MYTNPTGSNLNFNLYRGGKRFRKTRKYGFRKNRKHTQYRGGESFFRPKTPEHIASASKRCNTDCESNAKKLCDVTCKAATIAALDVKNTGISREFIDDLTSRIKKFEEKNIQLTKENEILKQKYDMLYAVSAKH